MVILNEIESYILGFVQTDGHFDGQCFSIEISEKDEDIIHKLKDQIGVSSIYTRTRDTNFGHINTISLRIPDKSLVSKLGRFVPTGKKSKLITAPKGVSYSERDYWRGIVDGDGSLGIKRKDKAPYISINTSSDKLYHDYNVFLKKHIGAGLDVNRNKRDHTYNMVLLLARAMIITSLLYKDNTISINRKNELANSITSFDIRGFNSRIGKVPFSEEENKVILSNPHEVSVKLLPNHHPISISNRRRFLTGLQKYGFV